MTEPNIRFCKDNGTVYPSWQTKKLNEIFLERTTTQTLSDDAPQLSFTIAEGVIYPEDKKSNKRDFLMKDKSTKKFALTEYNDIIYNPANLKYGAIHRNKLGRGCVSPIYAIFYTETELPEFMELIVRDPDFIKKSLRYLEGTVEKLKALKPKDFLQMEVSVPCLDEQHKIASFFSDFDEIIEQSEKEVQNLEKQRKAMIQKIFSQEIHFKADDGTEFPEWEEKTIGEYCDILDNMRKPITKKDRKPGIYPYYGSTNIQDYIDDYIFDEPLVLLGEDSAPFMDFKEKPIAQLATGKFWVNNHAHCLRPHGNVAFFYYSIVHKDIREYINNPSRAKLNQEDMLKIPIPVPCLAEQQKIANFLSIFDKAISYAKQELDKWKELKKGLLQQMFV